MLIFIYTFAIIFVALVVIAQLPSFDIEIKKAKTNNFMTTIFNMLFFFVSNKFNNNLFNYFYTKINFFIIFFI